MDIPPGDLDLLAIGEIVVDFIFTMGADGIILSESGKMTHIPARPVDVVDATGAGDAFWAGFLMALLDGRPLEESVLFGREIVERKLTTVGPLPDRIDRDKIYARIRGDASTAIQGDQE